MAEILDEDTKSLLNELESEGFEVDRPDKPKEEPAEEPPKEEQPPKEEPSKEPENEKEEPADGKEKEKPNRPIKMMPVWQHEVAVKKIEKEIREKLLEEIESRKPAPKDEPADAPDDDLDAFAKEVNADKATLEKLVSFAAKRLQLPPEIQELAKEARTLKEIKAAYEENKAEQAFNEEFGQDVQAIVEAEYPGITAEQLASLKTKLKEYATTAEYVKTPLKVIYRGLDDFREFVPKRKTAESSGKSQRARTDVVDFENVSEADLDKLDDDAFEKLGDYWERKEGKIKR